jgi:hypothetical protein
MDARLHWKFLQIFDKASVAARPRIGNAARRLMLAGSVAGSRDEDAGMKPIHPAVAGALLLVGCAQGSFAPVDTATMPRTASGAPELTQDQAIGLASWALGDPANTAGNPERAARAIAAEDWLAGQTTLYGNFGGYAPAGEPSWARFREQVRAAVGVAPDAPSQEVVDRLLAAADSLAAGNADAAKRELAAPVFALGPDATLRALTHLPSLPAREWAFAELGRNVNRGGGGPGR